MIVVIDTNFWITSFFHASPSFALHNFRRRLEAIESHWGHFLDAKICAFDSKTSERKKFCPSYKSKRKEKSDELREMLQKSVGIALECDWVVAAMEGWESDDILASVAKQGSDSGHKVVLVTQDKDCCQCLVKDKVTQLRNMKMNKGKMEMEWVTADDVPKRFGVEAKQMIDFQTLVGDDGDDVDGVEGVGPKTAALILKERATLDELFANPWVAGLGEKLRTRLLAYQGEECEMTRRLVTLKTDLDLTGIIDFKSLEALC